MARYRTAKEANVSACIRTAQEVKLIILFYSSQIMGPPNAEG